MQTYSSAVVGRLVALDNALALYMLNDLYLNSFLQDKFAIFHYWTSKMIKCYLGSTWADIQRSAKKYANLAKQDPSRARQNR